MKLAPGHIANVIIGTAGHIDHGKTRLVEALTGLNADRWEEERSRGITIDIGFASRELPDGRRVGFIDVPGHERFVRHMIAGAAGVDVVLLVVAADDGVMPQTREHLDIMQLLGARDGVVAVTKIDIDRELADAAVEEAADLLKGTFLEGSPIVPVSSVTGEGLDRLWRALGECVGAAKPRPAGGLFRMPVQRVFTREGFGTILTGIPVSGTVRVGDVVEVLPGGGRGRVRGVQAYFHDVELARAGHSTGLNITDIDPADCRRGQVIVPPDTYEPSALADARLRLLHTMKKPLVSGVDVRFYTGTAEVTAGVAVIDRKQILPGEEALVQFRLKEPVVFGRLDRYVIRNPSPAVTIGGGGVIGPGRRRSRANRPRAAREIRERELAARSDDAFVEHLVETAPGGCIRADDLRRASLLVPGRTQEIVRSLLGTGRVLAFGPGLSYAHARTVGELSEKLRETLADLHAREPHLPGLDVRRAAKELGVSVPLVELAVGAATSGVTLVREKGHLRLDSHRAALSGEDTALAEKVEGVFGDAGFSPPREGELRPGLGVKEERLERVIAFLEHTGRLVRIGAEMLLHAKFVEQARGFILRELKEKGAVEVRAVKDFVRTSRKYLMPLLEYFDRTGLTRREGERRVAGEKAQLDESGP